MHKYGIKFIYELRKLIHYSNMKILTFKILPIYLIFLFFTFEIHPSTPYSNDLETSIIEIVKAFDEKDTTTINELIHPDFGLVVLFKLGVFNEFQITKRIDFNSPIPPHMPYFDFQPTSNLQYDPLPNFDCETNEWNKEGLYCDTTQTDSLLSTTAQNLIEFRKDKIDPRTISSFKEIERNSHRVVLVDHNGNSLVFYVMKIKNQWYLTVLDRVSDDCSA